MTYVKGTEERVASAKYRDCKRDKIGITTHRDALYYKNVHVTFICALYIRIALNYHDIVSSSGLVPPTSTLALLTSTLYTACEYSVLTYMPMWKRTSHV